MNLEKTCNNILKSSPHMLKGAIYGAGFGLLVGCASAFIPLISGSSPEYITDVFLHPIYTFPVAFGLMSFIDKFQNNYSQTF
tara:strand:+ start:143 stop:388 length:246 start_codon:yes stop_codon:yes gene_type:complete